MVWNPFRELEQMERMVDETMNRPMMWRRVPGDQFTWMPSMELYEKENMYVVRLEMPGVKPEDVEISISGDTLTIKGERKPPENISEDEYQLCELCYGNFSRSISLPEPVNSDKVEANFENGILDIRLPKAEEVKTKQIKIQNKQVTSEQAPKEAAECDTVSESEKAARGDMNTNP